MRVDLLSLFPEYFQSPLKVSILGRALRAGSLDLRLHQLRDYAEGARKQVDDRSFGGGPGMVLMARPIAKALAHLRGAGTRVIHLSPQGTLLNRDKAKELSGEEHLILLCGHYEGIDQRILDHAVDEEISIGDVVLTNGCLPALVLLDALVRFLPGALGDEASHAQDSFEQPMLDHPHYTHPRVHEGRSVPSVLLQGDHQKIAHYRAQEAQSKTWRLRPDLAAAWACSPAQKERQEESQREGQEERQGERRGEPAGSLQAALLPTRHFREYRRLLSREMGLPWIDKNSTMGALLLRQGQIVLWHMGELDAGEAAKDSPFEPRAQFVVKLDEASGQRWQQAARRSKLYHELSPGERGAQTGAPFLLLKEASVTLCDPLGWRLHLERSS